GRFIGRRFWLWLCRSLAYDPRFSCVHRRHAERVDGRGAGQYPCRRPPQRRIGSGPRSAEKFKRVGGPSYILDGMTETRSPNVWATFQARYAHAMLDFLTNVFGFEATAVYE